MKEITPLTFLSLGLSLSLSLILTNSCSRDSGQVIGNSAPLVITKASEMDIKTDHLAIQSLKNESRQLKRDYVTSYYKFKTKQGRKNFLSLLKNNTLTDMEAKKMAFRYIENNIEDIDNLTPYERSKIENLFDALTNYQFVGKELISYLAFDKSNDLTLDQAKKELNQFSYLKNKKESDFVPFEFEVYQKYAADHYLTMIAGTKPTEKTLISLPIVNDQFKNKLPLVSKVISYIDHKYYKTLLDEKSLYTGVGKINHENSRMKDLEWTLNGSLRGGRCGTQPLEERFSNTKKGHWSHDCHYGDGNSTDSINDMNAYISSNYDNFTNNFDIIANVASDLRGGYADDGNENQTAEVHYHFQGLGVIPACSDIFKCSPFVKVSRRRRNGVERIYNNLSDSNPRGSSDRVIIGDRALGEGESIVVDRSNHDVKIDIELERNDAHVGACCTPGAGQQRIEISVSGLENTATQQGIPLQGNPFNHSQRTIIGDLQIPGSTNSGELLNLIDSFKENGINYVGFLQIPQVYNRLLNSELAAGRIPYDLMFGVSNLIDQLLAEQLIPLEGKELDFLSLFKANILAKIKVATKGHLLIKKSVLQEKSDRNSFELTQRLYQDIKNVLEKREVIEVKSLISRASQLKVNLGVDETLSDSDNLYQILNKLSLIRKKMIEERLRDQKELELIELSLGQIDE